MKLIAFRSERESLLVPAKRIRKIASFRGVESMVYLIWLDGEDKGISVDKETYNHIIKELEKT